LGALLEVLGDCEVVDTGFEGDGGLVRGVAEEADDEVRRRLAVQKLIIGGKAPVLYFAIQSLEGRHHLEFAEEADNNGEGPPPGGAGAKLEFWLEGSQAPVAGADDGAADALCEFRLENRTNAAFRHALLDFVLEIFARRARRELLHVAKPRPFH
jgi:hypothetical protein